MLLTYTSAISAANTPRWADNGTKTAPIEVTDTMAYDSIKWAENLDAVTVVAKKPLVKSELDKMTYDVESDPEAQANSVLEMLRKVPMVTVDGQDNIMVNNSSSFKVYVNGKSQQHDVEQSLRGAQEYASQQREEDRNHHQSRTKV